MPNDQLQLTVVITVVSGKEAVRRCLAALTPQVDFAQTEIIVPFDEESKAIGELQAEFPLVVFYFIEKSTTALTENFHVREHRLFDRRRAAGLRIARGRIVALTEDHALPATDWCREILRAHDENPAAAIGGAIENAVDEPLNWAWYYCDFGRYGRPLKAREVVRYVSDVNVSYKRSALMEIYDLWRAAYHETTVHWALQERGVKLALDEKIVVFQHRPKISLKNAWLERIAWGRIFAETRARRLNILQRFGLAAGTLFLPFLLNLRIIKNMLHQQRTARQITLTQPFAAFLLAGWSLGECAGYLLRAPQASDAEPVPVLNSAELKSEQLVNQ